MLQLDWNEFFLFFREETMCLLQFIKFSNFLGIFEITMNFLRKNEKEFISNTKFIKKI